MKTTDGDTRAVLSNCIRRSYAGEISFPDYVAALVDVGVESYQVDYRRGEMRFYAADGGSEVITVQPPKTGIIENFDAEAVQDAVRGAQRNELVYPDFVARTVAAGCVGYTVWITGRHVTYFGRRGETHIERFPSK